MRSLKKYLSMMLAFMMLAAMYPAQAAGATDEEALAIYNATDYYTLQDYLNEDSGTTGQSNGDMISTSGYDQYNPETWTGVRWSSETPKKITSIGHGGEWSGKTLAGSLDLSNLTELQYVNISNNKITSLVINDSTGLMTLYCNNNELSSLDLDGSFLIGELYCQDNNLTSLELPSQKSLMVFKCDTNRLSNIQVYFVEGIIKVSAHNSGYVELYLDRRNYENIKAIATAVPAPGADLDRWILVGEWDYGKVNPIDLWSLGVDRAEAVFTESEIPTTYTVTFNPNGGTRIGGGALVQSVRAGYGAIAPILYRYGYDFGGWDRTFSEFVGNITVNAIWYPAASGPPTPPPTTPTPLPAYAVTFYPNGGTRTGGGELKQYIPKGDGAYAPNVTREGYTFAGWDVPYDTIKADLKVTAIWNPYTVTFDPNGGTRTGGGELVQKVESGAAATAPIVAYENHVFDNWDSDFSTVTKDMTVKALWSLKKLNVTFDPDGGTRTGGGELAQKVEYGGSAVEPVLEKEGYSFEDWDMDYSNVTDDITITALWEGPDETLPEEARYTITYDLNGGKGNAPVDDNEYAEGDVAELADGSDLDYDNFTFLGWALSPDGDVISEDTITVNEDTVLYAIWEESEEASPVPKTGDIPGLAYGIPMLLSGSALISMDIIKKRKLRK